MKTEMDVSESTLKLMTTLIPVGYVFVFSFLGFICPFFAKVFRNSNSALPWPKSILPFIQWYWTLPAGLFLALVISRINKKLSLHKKVWFNFIASILLLAAAASTSLILMSLAF
jgi:hypothetical protein